MKHPFKTLKVLIFCSITAMAGQAQNLDLVEGFYPIVEKGAENSRQMLLRGDSSLVYYIAEEPVVTKHHRIDARISKENNALYFIFGEQGTKKLFEFTADHMGGKIGFVYLGSLRKIYTIKESTDNGIIELMSDRIYRVDIDPSILVK